EWSLWFAQPSWTNTGADGSRLQWRRAGQARPPGRPDRRPACALAAQARPRSWFAICPSLFHALRGESHEPWHDAPPGPERFPAPTLRPAQMVFASRLSPSSKKPSPFLGILLSMSPAVL